MNCATSSTKASVVAHNGHATTCTTNVDHLINVLQLEKLDGNRTKGICNCATTGRSTTSRKAQQGHRPPGNILQLRSLFGFCTITGRSTTSDERQLRHQNGFCTVRPRTCRCTTTGTSTTWPRTVWTKPSSIATGMSTPLSKRPRRLTQNVSAVEPSIT